MKKRPKPRLIKSPTKLQIYLKAKLEKLVFVQQQQRQLSLSIRLREHRYTGLLQD